MNDLVHLANTRVGLLIIGKSTQADGQLRADEVTTSRTTLVSDTDEDCGSDVGAVGLDHGGNELCMIGCCQGVLTMRYGDLSVV